MAVNGRVQSEVLGTKNFDLSLKDAQDKNDWKMRKKAGNWLTYVYLENVC